jgi:2-oxoglutarate ferredoxin oxidoreductase subunit alpha
MNANVFPFPQSVADFIETHDKIYLVEQNRDAQMRALLINELEVHPKKLIAVLNYDGFPITAATIVEKILEKR